MTRFLFATCIAPIWLCSLAGAAPPEARLPEKHRAFFKAHCLDCHDSATQEGKVDLEALSLSITTIEQAELWQNLLKDPRAPKKIYPVDASGELPSGETFSNVHGLKKALMKQERKVAGSLFEGLLCYALGRDVSFTDREIIETNLDELAEPNADGDPRVTGEMDLFRKTRQYVQKRKRMGYKKSGGLPFEE